MTKKEQTKTQPIPKSKPADKSSRAADETLTWGLQQQEERRGEERRKLRMSQDDIWSSIDAFQPEDDRASQSRPKPPPTEPSSKESPRSTQPYDVGVPPPLPKSEESSAPKSESEDPKPEVNPRRLKSRDPEKTVPTLECPPAEERAPVVAAKPPGERSSFPWVVVGSVVMSAGLLALLGLFLFSGEESKPAKPATSAGQKIVEKATGPVSKAVAPSAAAEPKPAAEPEVASPPQPTAPENKETQPPKPEIIPAESPPEDKAESEDFDNKETVVITLNGLPENAEVFVDGKRSTSPFTVPIADTSVKVEVRAPGYSTTVKRVVPIRDKAVLVRMKKK